MTQSRPPLTVEVLGPLRAFDARDREVTPPGTLQRRLLALLVLRRGRIVSVDRAIDALWSARLPGSPAAALQNHMFRLRRCLPDDLIDSIGDGYRLDPARVQVDADLLAAAVAAPPGALTAHVIGEVLGRWRGPAYPELTELDEARIESERLEELRYRAAERRAEARLSAGELDGLAADLIAIADAQPLRERPRALLMRVLSATGRPGEALRVYDDFRRVIGAELGIEPSPELAAQHAGLLNGGPRPGVAPSVLPFPPTPLIGRDELAKEVIDTIRPGSVMTLVGPGGVGKTRLLLELGHRMSQRHEDSPVVLCELASADAVSADDVVAAALGIDGRPGTPLARRIADVLGEAPLTLLLDNCEHVLEPTAALVERIVTRCPNVLIVATSRERLRVPGERVCSVPPLAADHEHSPAVQLFLQRGRAVNPGFSPAAGDLACVTEIVRRLDGLPLAIELAAARLHTSDVWEIAAGLDRRFTLLSSGYRTSARHGSLRAAVSWSFDLLDTGLREVFADLSAFSGSFTVADAAAVCDIDEMTVSAALAQLVERSLVMRSPGRRYVLLETLREFGAEHLRASGRSDGTAERHARHFVVWAEASDRRLLQPGGGALADIDTSIPELRNALGWLLDHAEVEVAGRLVTALFDYGFMRLRPDVVAWSERVTAADPEDRSPLAARVWAVSGYASWMAGDVPETGVRSARALEVATRSAVPVPPEVLTIVGSYELFEGRLESAATWYQRAAQTAAVQGDVAQRLVAAASEVLALGYAGDPSATALSARLLTEHGDAVTPYTAYAWYCAGEADVAVDLDRARARLERALDVATVTNASFVTDVAAATKASIDARVGDPDGAAREYRRLITHWRRAGMWATQWTVLRSIAVLTARRGGYTDAAVLEGAVRATASGHRIFGADEEALAQLGALLRERLGDDAYEAARARGAVLDGEGAVEHALRVL